MLWECVRLVDLQYVMIAQLENILGDDWRNANTEVLTLISLCFCDHLNITKKQVCRIAKVMKGYLSRIMKRRDNYIKTYVPTTSEQRTMLP